MKLYIFLIIGLFLLSSASALETSISYDSNVIVKDLNSEVTLKINIQNADTSGDYNFYTFADLSLSPKEIFKIPDGNKQVEVKIKPSEYLDVKGLYTFTITLNHRNVKKYDNKFTVNLVNLEDIIEISSDAINPEKGKVTFFIKNKQNVALKNLTASFSSILFDFKKTINIPPYEQIEITAPVDEEKLKKTKAGVYIIKSIFQTEKGKKEINGNLYLGEKKGITTTEDSAGFLIKTKTITKINSGNVVEDVQIKIRKNIFSRLFVSFNIEPNIVDRQGFFVEYTWTKDKLNPAEIFTIKAKTNYVLPFSIILALTLTLFFFKRYSETSVEVLKTVSPIRTKNGEFALRIRLSLKARKDIENVTLVDKVPAILKIYKKFDSLKPDKIDPESRRLHWHLGDLNKGEERALNYVVYSKVGIVGKFSLPSALGVFEREGKIHEVNSNKVFFMNEQVSN